MTEIVVQLGKPSLEGRLHYKPSVENIRYGRLYVESQQPRRMAYCVNVHAGWLLLYFDTQRLLKEIEFGIHQRWWGKSITLSEPKTDETSDIFLLGVKSYHGKWKHSRIARRSDRFTVRDYAENELPITAITNPELSVVQIGIGVPEQDSHWVSLSEHCWAQIANNHLKGFFIKGIVTPSEQKVYLGGVNQVHNQDTI